MAPTLPCNHPLCYLLLLLLLLLKPVSSYAQTSGKFSLGSSLTAQKNDSFWASPSGDFAFGFQQIGNGGFLLAIWFNKVPEKTIIWSANSDNPKPRGSKVELTTDGEFILNDQKGKQMWKADLIGPGVAYAAMLDTGNFVLASQNSTYLWESFNHPTDTILPTQILEQGSKLVARYSETNYSRGKFMFSLQTDGNLVLYTTDFPMDSANFAYWESDTVGSGFLVIFNQSGNIYLIGRNGSILNEVLPNKASTPDFYQRGILEYDGVFRQYVYPKTAGSRAGGWSSLSSFIPENICTAITAGTGSGACGFNSYCTLGDDQRPYCQCPPGYTFLDPHDQVKGCRQNFFPEICSEGSHETGEFDFVRMTNVDWPLSDYDRFQLFTEDECRKACLDDCFCAVAIVREGDCWKKKFPLSNGRFDSSNGRIALIKVRKDNSTFPLGSEGKDQATLILTGSVLLGSSVLLNILLLLATAMFIYRLNQRKPMIDESRLVMLGTNLKRFAYDELEEATDGFKDELGTGAFATVYKGTLAHDNGNLVAVKKLDRAVGEGDKQEFEKIVGAIGRTIHKNLVQLLGFCNKGQHRLLVYEFMSNGSLATFLFGNSRPSWYKRMEIILGTARGLLYLHEECSIQDIHGDINPQNILLDDSLTARISDFGLAKLLKMDQTGTTTGVMGTKGYAAPEWFKKVPITFKVDVYSFGIVLLELIFCRKNFEPEVEDEKQMVLGEWAYDCYKEGKLDLLVGNDQEALDDIKRLEKFVMVAFWCTQEDPSQRPTMKTVMKMLEGATEVPVLQTHPH